MNDWFGAISANCALPADAAQELEHRGFTVIRDALPHAGVERLSHVYDAAMSSATGAETKIGSTTTRLGGLDFAAHLQPQTRARLGSLARYVLDLKL